ncbi:MAG TPA: chorismate-binding protein, partial [Fimbriimonadaceae bacterium]|nr:chorismate-binding protein [Fimbriimonadaceae bacterium]
MSRSPVDGCLSLYAPDFLLESSTPWLVYLSSLQMDADELVRLLDEVPGSGAVEWRGPEFEGFAASYASVQTRIVRGELLKAVPIGSRTTPKPLDIGHRAAALRLALRLSQGFPMSAYGFWNQAEGMIGATPELLFEQARGGLTTMALAGTRPVDTDRGCLLDDPKELLEHELVIDGIAARLSPIGTVSTGQTREVRLPTLVHLHTPIQLEPFVPISFQEAVAALHPTPAIGAWPLEAG